jgi:hypothetical protein
LTCLPTPSYSSCRLPCSYFVLLIHLPWSARRWVSRSFDPHHHRCSTHDTLFVVVAAGWQGKALEAAKEGTQGVSWWLLLWACCCAGAA